jgi:ADP-ribose pyrophosphatase YjhB (NUDIX family)
MKKPKLPRQGWTRSPITKVKTSEKTYGRVKKISWRDEITSQNRFRYCPICSAELIDKRIDHHRRLACSVCGYVYYNNPVPACAVILEKEGKILLCQRKYPPYPDGWTLPSGFLEANETPQECARREAKEETNLDIEVGEVFGVYAAGDDPRSKVTLIVFNGRIKAGEARPGDDAKALDFFTPQNLPAKIAFRAHRLVLKEYYSKKGIQVHL